MQILDHDHGRRMRTCVLDEARHDGALAAVARGIVHGVVKCAIFAALGQIEEVVEEGEALRTDPPFARNPIGGALALVDVCTTREAEQAA
jgi:hypothetical protein